PHMPATRDDWFAFVVGMIVAIFGFIAKDATTGSKPPIVVFAVLAAAAGAFTLVLTACSTVTAPGASTSFGSPTRIAHFAACEPYMLGGAGAIATGVENKDSAQKAIAAMQARQQSGTVDAEMQACGPYFQDLAASGNADAAALLAKTQKK